MRSTISLIASDQQPNLTQHLLIIYDSRQRDKAVFKPDGK